MITLIKDAWYTAGDTYYQYMGKKAMCSDLDTQVDTFREAGSKRWGHMIPKDDYNKLVPAILCPDFTHAKEGDSCHSLLYGESEITLMRCDGEDDGCIYINMDGECPYGSDGRIEGIPQILLFNSYAQYHAYEEEMWGEYVREKRRAEVQS